MARPGEGQVTFLFTDIEASTRAWEDRPNAMSLSLAVHDELLQGAVKSSGGTVFKHTGDGVCAAFPTASGALAAALAAQLALQAQDWPETGPLRVRMALHSGVAEHRGGDFFGPPLNRTSRLLSTAHGGQVILSLVTAELVRDALPPEANLIDLGEHRLADLARPERVFQLIHPALPSAFPPLRSLAVHRHNLPVAASSFIGRNQELVAVADVLRSSRMVTLVGVGGVGKTRLALQVAAGMLEAYRDGVFLVDLAPLADPALVASQVGRALGLVEAESRQGSRAVIDGLCEQLGSRAVLLLIDNCEHLIDSVAGLCDAVLQRCPDVALLATSREPLAIGGEVLWRVPSLALPPTDAGIGETLAAADSVILFCERARAADADFALCPENARAVARICRRLDGIPLALELAAARIRVLTPEQVADRLDDRFRLLSVGPRTAAARQQTLRATMDWSYELLEEPERILLQRISVFAGSFDLEAVEGVTADGTTIAGPDVLDLLARLVDKSLVGARGHGREVYYRLLETVRQYAGEKLAGAGAEDDSRRRHRDYFLGLADDYLASDPLSDGRWLVRFDHNYDNLRAALEWSLARGDAEACLHLVATLSIHWVLSGNLVEGRARLEEALAVAPPTPTPAWMRAMNGLGFLLAQQGDFDRSLALHTEALAVARAAGEAAEAGVGAFYLAGRLLHRGELDQAAGLLAEAREGFGGGRTEEGAGWCEMMLGWVSLARDDRVAATRHFEAALELGRPSAASNLMAHTLGGLAPLAALAGDGTRAEALAEKGVEAARGLGLQTILVMALTRAAEVAILLGRWERTHAVQRELLAVLRNTGGRAFLADALEMAALVQERAGCAASAARLLGTGEGVRRASNESPDLRPISPLLEECSIRLTGVLGRTGFECRWREGSELSPAGAVEFALRELEAGPGPAVPAGGSPPRSTHGPPITPGILRTEGNHWVVGYGSRRFDLPDTKGLRYLARLLADPDHEVHVLDLVAAAEGGGRGAEGGDAGPVLDAPAKAAYRRRVHELQEEIDEAHTWNDPERAARAEAELEAVTRQLVAAVGLGGRDRPAAATAERARVSVRKAIAAAVSRIADHDPDLGLLLSTTVKTGIFCSYTPDPRLPVTWAL